MWSERRAIAALHLFLVGMRFWMGFSAIGLTPLPAATANDTWLNENGDGGDSFCGLLILVLDLPGMAITFGMSRIQIRRLA